MIEGKIADEDFNGDPAYNVLGQKGIRGRASAKKAKDDDEEGEEQVFVQFILLCNQRLTYLERR